MLRKYADNRAIVLFEKLYVPSGLVDLDNKVFKIDFGESLDEYEDNEGRQFKKWSKDKHGFWTQGEFDCVGLKDGRVIKITDFGRILIQRCKKGKPHGEWTTLNFDGTRTTENYIDGVEQTGP